MLFYTKQLYWTVSIIQYFRDNECSVLFSSRMSILFSIFVIMGVVLTDIERGLVVHSIFSD
jgi:hypothetical protein